MKEVWFPFKFNDVDLQLFILPSNTKHMTDTSKQYNVRIQPTNALTIIATRRLIHYLEAEGFLD